MQTKLDHLRTQLMRLGRQRRFVRWGSSLCRLSTVLIWTMLATFWLDWAFNLPVMARAGLIISWILVCLWLLHQWVWPLVQSGETVDELALIVEKEHQIDSDLVAGLQFDQPQAVAWGSTRLTSAVVDYVAEYGASLNVFEGFSYQSLPRQALLLGTSVFVVAALVLNYTDYASAFVRRFALTDAHYPTQTRLVSIRVSGQEVEVFAQAKRRPLQIPYGAPIAIDVNWQGDSPSGGHARLSGSRTHSVNRIELSSSPQSPDLLQGQVPPVAESFRLQLEVGDALADPIDIEIIPLPVVEVSWTITPPPYAASSLGQNSSEAGTRQISVLEGSAARLEMLSVNKRLRSARLTTGESICELLESPPGATGQSSWSLPPGTLFDSIRETIRYEIQVTDEDGLTLESPLIGQFRTKSDRSPRIAASAVTSQVLPMAQPTLDYLATDDFGIARIDAIVDVGREGSESSRHEFVAQTVSDQDPHPTSLRGQVRIPLSSYELKKGDEVKVTLRVTDWRGALEGEMGESDSLRFSVTDLNGILLQTGEEDQKSAKQLDEILRRELGISDDTR